MSDDWKERALKAEALLARVLDNKDGAECQECAVVKAGSELRKSIEAALPDPPEPS